MTSVSSRLNFWRQMEQQSHSAGATVAARRIAVKSPRAGDDRDRAPFERPSKTPNLDGRGSVKHVNDQGPATEAAAVVMVKCDKQQQEQQRNYTESGKMSLRERMAAFSGHTQMPSTTVTTTTTGTTASVTVSNKRDSRGSSSRTDKPLNKSVGNVDRGAESAVSSPPSLSSSSSSSSSIGDRLAMFRRMESVSRDDTMPSAAPVGGHVTATSEPGSVGAKSQPQTLKPQSAIGSARRSNAGATKQKVKLPSPTTSGQAPNPSPSSPSFASRLAIFNNAPVQGRPDGHSPSAVKKIAADSRGVRFQEPKKWINGPDPVAVVSTSSPRPSDPKSSLASRISSFQSRASGASPDPTVPVTSPRPSDPKSSLASRIASLQRSGSGLPLNGMHGPPAVHPQRSHTVQHDRLNTTTMASSGVRFRESAATDAAQEERKVHDKLESVTADRARITSTRRRKSTFIRNAGEIKLPTRL